jgi:hypothetical protein
MVYLLYPPLKLEKTQRRPPQASKGYVSTHSSTEALRPLLVAASSEARREAEGTHFEGGPSRGISSNYLKTNYWDGRPDRCHFRESAVLS